MEPDDLQYERDFLLKEVEQVRKAYGEFIDQTRDLERYAILVTGTTWAWCASHADSYAFSLFVWFPALACGLFGLRAFGIHLRLMAARRYIAAIETVFLQSGPPGWARTQLAQDGGKPGVVAVTAYVFWAVLTVVTLGTPLFFRAHMHL
jgi:hypothetical protein